MPAGVALSPAAATAAGPARCDLAFETLDVLDLDEPARAAAAVPAHPATALGPLADRAGGPGRAAPGGPGPGSRRAAVSVTRTFLAWYRSGLATALTGAPGGGRPGPRCRPR